MAQGWSFSIRLDSQGVNTKMEFFPIWLQVVLWSVLVYTLFALGIAQLLALITLKVSRFVFYILYYRWTSKF